MWFVDMLILQIGHLRAQLDSVEDSQRNAASEYEKQLGSLRDEVCYIYI